LQGLPLSWSCASRTASPVTPEKPIPLGKCYLSRPLVFSSVPC
jgi:hypothetical protein